MIDKLACGCRHNGSEWTFMCEPCKAEHDEIHARWQAEHVERERQKQATRYL